MRLDSVRAMEALSRAERERIGRFIDSLAADPFKVGDYSEFDETGRSIQIRVIGRSAIAYWSDHPVQEVRIVDVVKADGPR